MNKTPISFPSVLRTLFCAGAFALLAGCAVEPARPTFYAAPEQRSAALASVVGARTTSGYTGDRTTYLSAVDGQPVENAKENFAYAIQVAPGYRTLTVAHARDALVATSEVTTELQAGRTYYLKAEPADAKNNSTDELYNIWLEDASTREPAGVKHLAKLNAVAGSATGPASNPAAPAISPATGEFLIRLLGVVLEAAAEASLEQDSGHSSSRPKASGDSAPPRQAPVPSPVPKSTPPVKSAPPAKSEPASDEPLSKMKKS
jgi:hypothetical protein